MRSQSQIPFPYPIPSPSPKSQRTSGGQQADIKRNPTDIRRASGGHPADINRKFGRHPADISSFRRDFGQGMGLVLGYGIGKLNWNGTGIWDWDDMGLGFGNGNARNSRSGACNVERFVALSYLVLAQHPSHLLFAATPKILSALLDFGISQALQVLDVLP